VSVNEAISHDEAVRRARGLAPVIRERARRCEIERRVPRESIEEFVAAGLGRVLLPRRWGGHELSHDAAFDVAVEIAAACGSTGWCCGFLNIHDWWLSCFPDEAQHDVWRDTPDVNLAAVIAPLSGTATIADGGFRVSGRWSWASGVDHCSWAIITAMVPEPDGRLEPRCLVIPRGDYGVIDTWFNVGMKGTGSNDIVVADVFVPAHRTVHLSDLREGTTPGGRVNTGPLYRVPLVARSYSLTAPALGIARGAFAEWIAWTRDRVATATGARIADLAPVQARLAKAELLLDAAEFLMRRNLDIVRGGGPIDVGTRARCASGSAEAVRMVCDAVDILFALSGSRGMFDDSTIQRAWRDVHTIATHFALNPDAAHQLRGGFLLGVPRDPGLQRF
jgi:3-hydroxy-9,10-secoandrosta-1,3,5(10)-triene-9,17-dione monooxygenase